MKKNQIFKIALVAALCAVVVVVVLKLLEFDNPTVIGGGVAGGVAGAVSGSLMKRKKGR